MHRLRIRFYKDSSNKEIILLALTNLTTHLEFYSATKEDELKLRRTFKNA